MSYIHGFPPIAKADATVLVLGSMPGKASLRAQQYYGHPQNAFWRIIESLLTESSDAKLGYAQRCDLLKRHNIALWDVLKTCTRSSSLDSDIVESSIVTNDFAGFFVAHPHIKAIFCNGANAHATYLKHVKPDLPPPFAALPVTRLPSTSPAYASMRPTEKMEHWRAIMHSA